MKVCDRHINRNAVDTLTLTTDDMRIDVCKECRDAVLAIFTQANSGASPMASASAGVAPEAFRRGGRIRTQNP